MQNFTNGALVFRIWHFDGTGEIIAKTQYMSDAVALAKTKAIDDSIKQPDDSKKWFYLAACESECLVQSFMPNRIGINKVG